ncbi:sulfatase [Rubinisphaera sp. JC750]|uniref:sulfatase family protein n=1 Tax=Rubinisphaera sp. JC750 TaxID=2898658 RepID=UPI001F0112BD|nr:sulfatase-like hydrolase/transferase [Rubinisphaera sp. JC750]
MLRLVACLMIALSAGVSFAAVRPNVVVLLADDLGYQDIGCYGGPVETPTLDQLAAKGARFTNFYSGCAVCSPSRATLLTGRHHIRAGVYSWIHDESQKSHLLERETTLAEVLKGAGYATAHVGKWHLGLPTKKFDKPTPDQHGFDYWFATWNNAEPSHKNPKNFIRNGKPVGQLQGYSCQLVAEEAINWLDEKRDKEKPFFLNVWFHEPHAPIAAPDEIVNEYGGQKDKAAVYSGTIDNTDRAIARLLTKLAEVDAIENTLIVYASDNGSYRDDRTGGLRGKKGVNWEGGIRVPGIFCWPGTIPNGQQIDAPAGVVDILPTVCGLLDLDKPERHLDGSNLAPLLTQQGEFERHQPLFWHLQKSRPIVAMRDGRYSLVADPDYELSTSNMFQEAWIPKIKAGGYTNFRLYDLQADPQQTTDLAAEKPELVKRMKQQLLDINASIMSDGADWHQQ